jgi:hypothetical protein
MYKSRGDATYLAWRIVGGYRREESLKASASGCFCMRRRGGPSAIWVLAVIEIWRAVGCAAPVPAVGLGVCCPVLGGNACVGGSA